MKLIYRLSCLFFLLLSLFSFAQSKQEDRAQEQPIEFIADYLEHEKINGEDVIIAKGGIEAFYNKEVIKADNIIYYQTQKLVKAKGNVIYLDKNGNKIYADELELKDKFKEGVITHFTTILSGGSTVKGIRATKDSSSENYFIHDGFFSSCKICDGKTPIWSIKSDEIILSPETEDIEFKKLKFFIRDYPVFFFPYFAHTTNLSKRRSGFFKGTFGQSSNLGLYAKIPYYFNIAPDKDFTFTLFPTTAKGFVYEMEYRTLTDDGNFNIAPIITLPKDKKSRTIYGDIRYDLRADGEIFNNNHGRMFFNIDYLSDNTFLKTFDYDNKDATRSFIKYSLNENNGYTRISSIYFQNLRDNQPIHANPLVLPFVEDKRRYDLGAGFYYDRLSNLLVLSNTDKYNIGRLSMENKIGYKFAPIYGQNIGLYTMLRTDGYNYTDINAPQNQFHKNKVARLIPEVGGDYSLPLYRMVGNKLLIIEPQINAKVSPNKEYNKHIYNEDSRDFDLSYANLFANSHFPGLDIVEPGTRMSYGTKATFYPNSQQYLSAMLGQAFSNQEFSLQKGNVMQTGFSNYVGELKYKISNEFMAWSKIRMDKGLSLQTSEFNILYNKKDFSVNLGYYAYRDSIFMRGSNAKRREMELSGFWQTSEEWRLGLSGKGNLSSDQNKDFRRGMTSFGSFVTYFYDCIGFTIAYNKDFTNIKNERPAQSIGLKINLKNLTR